jgi:hypothetical protein
MEKKLKPTYEFRVTIGVELPPEVAKRIAQAIQKSVLAEIAGIDLAPALAINFLSRGEGTAEIGNGSTQGIDIRET